MLEFIKELLKLFFVVEKIVFIGQIVIMLLDMNICIFDQFQEFLLFVQFDWSSSGFINFLDGVDLELYELIIFKLEIFILSFKVIDVFVRFMFIVEKISIFIRKLKREEYLSEEVIKVIVGFFDLMFMYVKVLMFLVMLIFFISF